VRVRGRSDPINAHDALPGVELLQKYAIDIALGQIRELWQYAGEDELPPDSLLQAQVLR
jgi:hypothetical protein